MAILSRSITQPYVYIIGWEDLSTWYIGCKYKKGAHPQQLFNRRHPKCYESSGKLVAPFVAQHGFPDFKWIVECDTPEEAVLSEHILIRELDAVNDSRYLNISDRYYPVQEVRRAAKRKGYKMPGLKRSYSTAGFKARQMNSSGIKPRYTAKEIYKKISDDNV